MEAIRFRSGNGGVKEYYTLSAMRFRLAVMLFIALAVHALVAQKEELFSDLNAYNAVPSPDGKYVAFVKTGWGGERGSGGFGRSNLVSEVKIADDIGKLVSTSPIDSFVGEWLPDGSALVCYRDWRYGLATPNGWIKHSELPGIGDTSSGFAKAERVVFLSNLKRFAWLDRSRSGTLIQTPKGPIAETAEGLPTGDLIVPSPDGHYLAIAGMMSGQGFHLLTFDLQKRKWTDLGEVTIHPDENWDYLKPSWNPWFGDSSRLTYISGHSLYVASPDGTHKEKLVDVVNGGLPVPSPDGTQIAYALFTPRPMKQRPDLKFWGGATLWVVPSRGGKPIQVTQPTEDTTYGLRWLSNSALIFDRISDMPFYSHARIWKVRLDTR